MKKIWMIVLTVMMIGLVGCNFLPEVEETTQAVDLENFYNISTVDDLKEMNMYQSYRLMNDIDLTGEEWVPIGTFDLPFRGNFNGNGYTISNLTITENHMGYNGLFGHVEGNIENLNITGVSIDIDDDFLINVGGLVGVSFGSIQNVAVSGNITVNSDTGNIYAGLLAGQVMTDLQEVFVEDVFSPNEVHTNQVNGQINISSTQIDYLGGLIGKSHNVIVKDNRVDDVDINVDGGSSVYIGGLIGHQFLYDFETIDDSLSFDKVLIFENIAQASFDVINVLSLSIGGLIGYNQNTDVENNFTEAMFDLDVNELAIGLLVGENWLSFVNQSIGVSNDMVLNAESTFIGYIVARHYGEIGDVDGFYVIQSGLDMSDISDTRGTVLTLTILQSDDFYQNNFSELSPTFIGEVQSLFSE